MAQNRFSINPPNILEALMTGVQGYEGAQKRAKQGDIDAARAEAGRAFQNGGDTRNVIARLVAAGDLPGAGVFSQLGKADTTDEIKEYNFDTAQRRARGEPVLPFGEWKSNLRRAGATSVNVNTGEKAFDKTVAEAEGKRFVDLNKAGQSAGAQLNSLDVMERATKDPNFYSGIGAERFALPLKQAISTFGGDPKAAASMEVFRSNASKQVMDSLGGSLGSGFSNADRDFVMSQVPGLQNTPEGNQQLIDISRKVAKRNQQIAQKARDYAKRNGGRLDSGFDDELAQWSEKNPLFPRTQAQPQTPSAPAQAAPAQAQRPPVRVNSKAERDALQPGTPYIAPDGSIRTKQ
jgi:hypothetical protein